MAGTLITTVPKSEIQALAFQGILVYSHFSQITAMIKKRFDNESFVQLFAEPEENTQNGDLDWYTEAPGSPRKYDDLPEEQKARAHTKIQEIATAILGYAQELADSRDPLKVTRGHILRLALSYPDSSYIYVVGEQPVLCCWGFAPGTPGVEPQSLTALATPEHSSALPPQAQTDVQPAPTPVPAAHAHSSAYGMRWLWWLLPIALAALLIILLFTSFGSLPALAGKAFFHAPQLPFMENNRDRSGELTALENEIAELRGKLEKHVAQCRPPAASSVAAAPKQPENALVIPENAQDTSFLEGKWMCETGLANSRTGQPVVVEFSFGASGLGECIVREQKQTCAGQAKAFMEDGRLHITHGELRCEGGNAYAPQSIICANAAGTAAECKGKAQTGNPWDATFTRISRSMR